MNKKIIKLALSSALVVALLAATGCVGESEAEGEAMGVWGYVAAADSAQLELADEQLDTSALTVDRVLVPENSWVVVHLEVDGMPGERVGLLAIDEGESRDLTVKLEGVTTPNVIVAIHADRGEDEEFEFDMEAKETSPDRPFFVDELELAKVVKVADFGVVASEGEAAIEVDDQPGVTSTLLVKRAVAPTGAWVVVHLDDNGMPGERVGLAPIPAGESTAIEVELYPGIELTDTLFIAVHADRGVSDEFEFDMEDKVGSPDQPFFVDGEEVATAASVK